MALLFDQWEGTIEVRDNIINAPNITSNDAAIVGFINFNGTFIADNNVISSDMKGIHFMADFSSQFDLTNNLIFSKDEKIEVEVVP